MTFNRRSYLSSAHPRVRRTLLPREISCELRVKRHAKGRSGGRALMNLSQPGQIILKHPRKYAEYKEDAGYYRYRTVLPGSSGTMGNSFKIR